MVGKPEVMARSGVLEISSELPVNRQKAATGSWAMTPRAGVPTSGQIKYCAVFDGLTRRSKEASPSLSIRLARART